MRQSQVKCTQGTEQQNLPDEGNSRGRPARSRDTDRIQLWEGLSHIHKISSTSYVRAAGLEAAIITSHRPWSRSHDLVLGIYRESAASKRIERRWAVSLIIRALDLVGIGCYNGSDDKRQNGRDVYTLCTWLYVHSQITLYHLVAALCILQYPQQRCVCCSFCKSDIPIISFNSIFHSKVEELLSHEGCICSWGCERGYPILNAFTQDLSQLG